MLQIDRSRPTPHRCGKNAASTKRLHAQPCIAVTMLKTSDREAETADGASVSAPPVQTFCAFNDIFLAEEESVRASYMEIRFDDGPIHKQKNSGVEISVRRPVHRAHVCAVQLAGILEVMQQMGLRTEAPTERMDVQSVCDRFNAAADAEPEEERDTVSFRLKEPVFNGTFAAIPERGCARRIWIKSKCTNAQLILDDQTSIPFEYGAELLIEFQTIRTNVFS